MLFLTLNGRGREGASDTKYIEYMYEINKESLKG